MRARELAYLFVLAAMPISIGRSLIFAPREEGSMVALAMSAMRRRQSDRASGTGTIRQA